MVTLFGCCFIILGINAYKQLKHRVPIQNKSSTYFNGTDYFDTTVIFISLDGFRNDYLERKVTPNIESIGKEGAPKQPSFIHLNKVNSITRY